jgi:hypothetical protein
VGGAGAAHSHIVGDPCTGGFVARAEAFSESRVNRPKRLHISKLGLFVRAA